MILILDLEDGVVYTSFLNGLKNEQFNFPLAEQKETTLAEALRKHADFIRATEICTENVDASKKAKTQGDRNARRGNRRSRLDIWDSRFTVDSKSILIEVKGHPMLRKP